jgi:hypothetical protein
MFCLLSSLIFAQKYALFRNLQVLIALIYRTWQLAFVDYHFTPPSLPRLARICDPCLIWKNAFAAERIFRVAWMFVPTFKGTNWPFATPRIFRVALMASPPICIGNT